MASELVGNETRVVATEAHWTSNKVGPGACLEDIDEVPPALPHMERRQVPLAKCRTAPKPYDFGVTQEASMGLKGMTVLSDHY
jgi:hypothetical protein